jgi:hypothetical protein
MVIAGIGAIVIMVPPRTGRMLERVNFEYPPRLPQVREAEERVGVG